MKYWAREKNVAAGKMLFLLLLLLRLLLVASWMDGLLKKDSDF